MPNYIRSSLRKLQHPPPEESQYAPHQWNEPTQRKKNQYADHLDGPPPLNTKQTMLVQKMIGTLLYYGLTMNSTILVDLGDIYSHKETATERTIEDFVWLLKYDATYPDYTNQWKYSDIILWVQINHIP